MSLTAFPNGLTISGYTPATDAVITVGAENTNVINVGVQLNDGNGDAMTTASWVMWYLADDAAGDTPSGTAPNGGVAVGTDGTIIEWAANLSGIAISEADGDIDLDLTDSGTPTFYLVVLLPSGERVVSDAITFA